jgi:6-phosphogluconolactonase
VSRSPKPPADRITLTREALATASCVVLLAAGEVKRDAIKKLMSGDPALPASGLENMLVVTDQALE